MTINLQHLRSLAAALLSVAARRASGDLAEINRIQLQRDLARDEIARVWKLVSAPDGCGSPFWTEPGLDDTRPSDAIAQVLAHLRAELERLRAENAELRAKLSPLARSIHG